ncbi:MAG TPA: PAS domain-containing protein [Alphaproteobacteria bacterium]|nr:PAS domain-containing protein [Alphaproteobacteria bacterium]
MAWRELYSYWRGCHADGQLPSRADIDPPIDIPKLLPNLIIFDRIDGHFRVRLAGSEVVRRGGRDATGRTLDGDMVSYDGIVTLIGFLDRVLATGEPVIYSVARGNDTAFGAVAILLPLSSADGKPEMVLGGVFYRSTRAGESSEPWAPGALTELSLPDMLEQDIGVYR